MHLTGPLHKNLVVLSKRVDKQIKNNKRISGHYPKLAMLEQIRKTRYIGEVVCE